MIDKPRLRWATTLRFHNRFTTLVCWQPESRAYVMTSRTSGRDDVTPFPPPSPIRSSERRVERWLLSKVALWCEPFVFLRFFPDKSSKGARGVSETAPGASDRPEVSVCVWGLRPVDGVPPSSEPQHKYKAQTVALQPWTPSLLNTTSSTLSLLMPYWLVHTHTNRHSRPMEINTLLC